MWSWGHLGVCGISWVSKWWHLHQIEAPTRISGKRMLRRKRELRRLPALMSSWSLLKERSIIAQVVVVGSSVGRGSCLESPDVSSLFHTEPICSYKRGWCANKAALVTSLGPRICAFSCMATFGHVTSSLLSSLTLTIIFQISFF